MNIPFRNKCKFTYSSARHMRCVKEKVRKCENGDKKSVDMEKQKSYPKKSQSEILLDA